MLELQIIRAVVNKSNISYFQFYAVYSVQYAVKLLLTIQLKSIGKICYAMALHIIFATLF